MISCDQHDYIEIACTFAYPLRVTMRSGAVFECIALDTGLNERRQECVQVRVDDQLQLLVLDDIATLEAKVSNPHFSKIAIA